MIAVASVFPTSTLACSLKFTYQLKASMMHSGYSNPLITILGHTETPMSTIKGHLKTPKNTSKYSLRCPLRPPKAIYEPREAPRAT